MPPFDLGRPLWIGRLATCACEGMAAGTPEGAAHGGGSPELRRRRRPGATVHQNACGLDREEEENGAKLTRGLLMAVGWCKRRAAKRGGRDHGRSPGRGLPPRFGASEGGDGVLGSCECNRRKSWVRAGRTTAGDVVAEEIELGWPSLGCGGVARSGGEEKVQGRRVLVRTAQTSVGDEEARGTCSPAAGGAGWPAMARRPASQRWRVCEGGEVQGLYGCGKGSAQGSSMPL
jgi:hypothetical protein